MPKGSPWLPLIMMVMTLGVILAGCAAVQEVKKSDAKGTEVWLAAAGFMVEYANTPEKADHLQTMTQRKLTSHQRGDQVYYIYADALSCKCLYIGVEENYQRYQQLMIQERIADEQRMTAIMNMDAAMNWGLWGPFDYGW